MKFWNPFRRKSANAATASSWSADAIQSRIDEQRYEEALVDSTASIRHNSNNPVIHALKIIEIMSD